MKTVEYGKHNQDVVILLHGGGLAWWNYREAAEMLADRFHVVLPVLDGHAGSDRPFTSIEDCADNLIRYVDETFGGHVLLMGGVSLGGQVLVEMLAQRREICDCAVVESTLVFPMKWSAALIRPVYAWTYPLIHQRWFAKWQFRSLHIKPELFEWYYRDTCLIRKEDMIAFLEDNARYRIKEGISECKANVLILVGSKELSVIKKSARQLASLLPGAKLEMMKGLHHGELSINHAAQYTQKLLQLAAQRKNPEK